MDSAQEFAYLVSDVRVGASPGAVGVEFPLGPADVGECRVERRRDGGLSIIRADSLVLICDQLVREWEKGHAALGVSYGDHILTLHAVNRTVSYGLVHKDETRGVWLARKSPEVESADGASAQSAPA